MIARTPKARSNAKAEAFIRGSKPAAGNGSARAKRNFVRVITNFDQDILERVDAAATEMGLNRSAFIVSSVAERLRALGA